MSFYRIQICFPLLVANEATYSFIENNIKQNLIRQI